MRKNNSIHMPAIIALAAMLRAAIGIEPVRFGIGAISAILDCTHAGRFQTRRDIAGEIEQIMIRPRARLEITFVVLGWPR